MDGPPPPLTGIIEGFYGPPWTGAARLDVMAWCHERGMTHYVYAPKDDPKHREQWRSPYDRAELDDLRRLVEADTLTVGFAISPGLSIDYHDPDDRVALAAKLDQVVDLGISLVVLALDDIPPRPGLGADHAALTTWAVERLDGRAAVVLVPTDYTSTRPTPYLDDLARGCPEEVPIAWTGPTVVCDEITVDEARARAAALGGRPPLVWDNYPVNDALMADRLFLGPLRGRPPALRQETGGWLANPMVQPYASMLPLASVAAHLRGDDPEAVWAAEADRLGLRVLAEACDGAHPRQLVDAVTATEGTAEWPRALDALRRWLKAAATVEVPSGSVPPALAEEAAPWVAQTRAEAAACLQAVRALEAARAVGPRAGQAPDVRAATEGFMVAIFLWQQARRGQVVAFGPRASTRPVLSQDDAGEWRFHRAALETDGNATDDLLVYAADVLAEDR